LGDQGLSRIEQQRQANDAIMVANCGLVASNEVKRKVSQVGIWIVETAVVLCAVWIAYELLGGNTFWAKVDRTIPTKFPFVLDTQSLTLDGKRR
jgi:hypothetical protein